MDDFKNNLNYTLNNIGIGNSDFLCKYLYININNIQEYLNIKLVLTICNHKNKLSINNTIFLIFHYQNNKLFISKNN